MNFKFVYFFILALFLWANKVLNLEIQSIIGGNLASINQISYQVSVQGDGKHRCGGGILGSRWVIATAHCIFHENVEDSFKSPLTVVASALNAEYLDKLNITVIVIQIFIPKAYKYGNQQYPFQFAYSVEEDIALLKLESGLNARNRKGIITTLSIPDDGSSFIHKNLVISGYGLNSLSIVIDQKTGMVERVGTSDYHLRFANVKVLSYEECYKAYFGFIDKNVICAMMEQRDENKPEGSCLGDSGGPLVYKNDIVVGILVAASFDCTENTKPAIYANVLYHSSFIINAMMNEINDDMLIYLRTKTIRGYEYGESKLMESASQ